MGHSVWVPAFAGTTERESSFSRRHFARVIQFRSRPLREEGAARPSREGAGKTGCAPHPRSRVRMHLKETCTRAYRFGGNTPAFPAQWLYVLYVLSLATWICLSPSSAQTPLRDLTPTLGRQDHTLSPYASVPLACDQTRPPQPAPRIVAIASRPS